MYKIAARIPSLKACDYVPCDILRKMCFRDYNHVGSFDGISCRELHLGSLSLDQSQF